MPNQATCPIFLISNVTGIGFDSLRFFIARLSTRVLTSGKFGKTTDAIEFVVDGTYKFGTNLAIAGMLLAGTIKLGH